MSYLFLQKVWPWVLHNILIFFICCLYFILENIFNITCYNFYNVLVVPFKTQIVSVITYILSNILPKSIVHCCFYYMKFQCAMRLKILH